MTKPVRKAEARRGATRGTAGNTPPVRRPARVARAGLVAYALVALTLVLGFHRVPLYGVETDLIGEYIPAARELRSLHPTAAHYATKGFGYPLMLAVAGTLAGGDDFLGARILNVMAAVAGVMCTWWFARMLAGEAVALVVASLLVVLPAHARTVFEAGTDQPAFALAMASTCLILRPGGGMRSRLAAGGLAGLAVITRYNMAFLLPAALIVLVRRRDSWRAYAVYAAGAAVPIGAWLATNAALTGSPFTNTNHLNVAMALYGGTRQWSPEVARSFHSLGDVLRFDPARAAGTIGRQLVTNLGRDLGELVPVWVGIAAAVGAFVRARSVAARPEVVAHWLLSYLALAPVFYETRFALYHAPFYLIAASVLLVQVPLGARDRTRARGFAPPRGLRIAVIVLIAIAAAVAATQAVRDRLWAAPHEARAAGQRLAADAPRGGRVMARKPHVAYYARMTYVPMPASGSFAALLEAARRDSAGWLYFSQFEMGARPELSFLAAPGVRVPGIEPVAFERMNDGRFFALYRLTGETGSPEALAGSTLEAQRRRVRERPDDARAVADLAGTLIQAGRAREAIPLLERAGQSAPNDPLLPSLESFARSQVGDHEGAAVAAERARKLNPRSWAILLQLGRVRIQQHRPAEAVGLLREAAEINPANTDVLISLGSAELATGDAGAAHSSFMRALSIAPDIVEMRVDLARMLADAGHVDRALVLIAAAPAEQRGPGSALARLDAELRARPHPR